jgi:cytidyltransferase-like protein
MIYCFDLDNTLCLTEHKKYADATPIIKRIKKVNELYDQGDYIKIYTARGMTEFSGCLPKILDKYWTITKNQLINWGLKHHELILGKPSYDFFIDDKACHSDFYFKPLNKTYGVIIGSFDVMHPGYIKAFKEAKEHCTHLTVFLHEDPSIDRPNKIKPVLTVKERTEILLAIKYIDDIIPYKTEEDLFILLEQNLDMINIRFIGDDYEFKDFTGKDLNIPTHIIKRNHGWSSTKYKNLIYDQIKN